MNASIAKAVHLDRGRRDRRGGSGLERRRARVVAHVRAAELDRALAAGASPDSSPALTLRAEALTSPRARQALGETLERVLARSRGRLPGSRVSPPLSRVDAARDELARLARRLRTGPPVQASGMARVHELLSDGSGPLFWGRSKEDLGAAVREAIAALGPSPGQPRAREIR